MNENQGDTTLYNKFNNSLIITQPLNIPNYWWFNHLGKNVLGYHDYDNDEYNCCKWLDCCSWCLVFPVKKTPQEQK